MSKPYFFVIHQTSINGRGMFFENFIDMLRYDSAKVRVIEPSFYLLETPAPPTEARWLSFRLPPWHITRDKYATLDAYRADVREQEKRKAEFAADMKAAP